MLLASLAVLLVGCANTVRPAETGRTAIATVTAARPSAASPAVTAQKPEVTPMATQPAALTSENLPGEWEGAVTAAGQKIATRLSLVDDSGTIVARVSFPQQNALDLPVDKLEIDGSKIHLEVMPAPRTAVFDGEVGSDGAMAGKFFQAGFEGTFEFRRGAAGAVAEPTAVAPYRAEEITFRSGAATLAGTLTIPEGEGPFPGVVLISGSGAQNRDEEIFGFKVFGVLADHLTRSGIAVLRYDDRGIGGSGPATDEDTSETFAGDVVAAIQLLKSRPEIAEGKIGLLGHSEGGVVAPLAARQSDDVDFVVLMAGPGLAGSEIIKAQQRLILEASGAPAEEVTKQAELQTAVIEAAVTGKGWDAVRPQLLESTLETAKSMPEDARKALGDLDKWAEMSVDESIKQLQGPWMQYFLKHDPAPVLAGVKVPVLSLLGEKDLQVPAVQNRDALEKALRQGGHPTSTVKVIPGANHLFQLAGTGSPTEYAMLKPEFAPGFLETIELWVKDATRS
jgi:hypothetical protein